VVIAESVVVSDLGDGLVLRWSTPADAEAIVELAGYVFRDKEDDPPNQYLSNWSRDLLSGEHPLMAPDRFALVVDTRKGNKPVACTCLIPQVWSYDGIPFGVGRPELVATLPEYRNRGLIRTIFDVIHARSLADGHLAQGITGIEYYYRQFGYEYALELGGGCLTHFSTIPSLAADQAEPYQLRPATVDDIPLIQSLYDREHVGCLVSTVLSSDYWRALIQPAAGALHRSWMVQIIVDGDGHACGYLVHQAMRWHGPIVLAIQTVDGLGLRLVLPSVLRALRDQAADLPPFPSATPPPPPGVVSFHLGSEHPAYQALGRQMGTVPSRPYAWYVRVADVPGFLRRVRPVLERRLAQSVMADYSGELRIAMAKTGLRLVFERGRLQAVENWQRPVWDAQAGATMPPLVFLQLLFGHRTLDELNAVLPDVQAHDDDARLLFEALFPKRHSHVLPLD